MAVMLVIGNTGENDGGDQIDLQQYCAVCEKGKQKYGRHRTSSYIGKNKEEEIIEGRGVKT
jgi:hypothetical protein